MSCLLSIASTYFFLFFFNDTATTEIYTLSLHDALPIYLGYSTDLASLGGAPPCLPSSATACLVDNVLASAIPGRDRKSTRLNSSHANISYAVFCLKKKKKH